MPDFSRHLRLASPTGPDSLAAERAGSHVPVQALAQHLFAQDDFLKRQERILKVIQAEPLLSKTTQQHLSRPDRYKLGLARAKLLRRLSDKLDWDYEDDKMAEYLVDDVSPYFLHMTMFATTVREQASEEQKAYWTPLIDKWKIIGSYAQTELGHGSNVRGLELRATYDPKAREFILHSPTLTSSKWWNGSLGATATHAIVVAQLFLPSKDDSATYTQHGPHPFIIRVRDPASHKPLPGIIVGDIGPKYGYAPMDNAYMLFDQFRIPHSAFLSRYSHVDPGNGTYSTSAQSPAVVYGSLTNVRVNIIMHARLVLARAVTIACRYLSIRRQFRDRDAKIDPSSSATHEMVVLDYPTVQIRVLPLLATSFALHYSGLAMGIQYASARQAIERGDFSLLSDMHATSSGLKSLCTTLAADGIETCRRALGGHGFGGGSGLVQLNADYLSKVTVEGDNWMITQQTAAYLIKKMTAVLKEANANGGERIVRQKDPTWQYFTEHVLRLQKSDAGRPDQVKEKIGVADGQDEPDIFNSDRAIVEAFTTRLSYLTYQCYHDRVINQKPWTAMLVELHRLAIAYSEAVLVRNFYAALYPADQKQGSTTASFQKSSSSAPPSSYSHTPPPSKESATGIPHTARSVLLACFQLFALNTMTQSPVSFLSSKAVSLEKVSLLPGRVQELMARIRPHAVALVDAWSIPDYLLDSALGRSDGKVYEELFDRAHNQNPLNRITVNPYYWEEEVVKGEGPYKPRL